MSHEDSLAPDDAVRVTEADIIAAVRADQYNCAIVCAIQRKYPKARRVRVNSGTIAFSIDETRFVYPTPDAAVESIIKPFDEGGAPEPGLVRLKGGISKPVQHSENPDDKIRNERERRRYVVTRRAEAASRRARAVDASSRAGYQRFAPDQ